MKIHREFYGKTKKGEDVYRYLLKNSKGTEVAILNYGAIINKLLVRDRRGDVQNIVLTLPDLSCYEDNPAYIGCVVGRYAGRIKDGKLVIGNRIYRLSQNEGKNTLHGGFVGFNKRVWEVESRVCQSFGEVSLSYLSPDGEEGFPGNLQAKVIYRLDDEDQLEIVYQGISDKDTYFSPTNHSYFNLSGTISSVEGDNLTVYSSKVVKMGEDLVGEKELVDLPLLRGSSTVKDYVDLLEGISPFRGIDHTFYLGDGELQRVAKLYNPSSGRSLEVSSNCPYVNIYSGNFLGADILLENGKGVKYGGICFETCEQPNGPYWGSNFLQANTLYSRKTVFKFKVE
ncbi:aldose 1-epimerase [Anaerobranca californiensis DSM 14826]|uniref:Aldose 1-epimerase n=1 Tax=Anaerobranca californiensis DSM 14826 TaxID=1120989 RepID=A0A1M6K6A1_9FIRM|nr:aldose epimerase family protein [Anaerobranca californiensis]SHJ54498.1 aldose 1-epimerase [Anaerobranca californiensis DSM 14826]